MAANKGLIGLPPGAQERPELVVGWPISPTIHGFPGWSNTGEANISAVADTAYLTPIIIPTTMAFTGGAINVNATGTGTAARIVLWEFVPRSANGESYINGSSANVVVDFGTVAIGTTGYKTATISRREVPPGFYLIGVVADGTYTLRTTVGHSYSAWVGSRQFGANFTAMRYCTATHAYGSAKALPSVGVVNDAGAAAQYACANMRWVS